MTLGINNDWYLWLRLRLVISLPEKDILNMSKGLRNVSQKCANLIGFFVETAIEPFIVAHIHIRSEATAIAMSTCTRLTRSDILAPGRLPKLRKSPTRPSNLLSCRQHASRRIHAGRSTECTHSTTNRPKYCWAAAYKTSCCAEKNYVRSSKQLWSPFNDLSEITKLLFRIKATAQSVLIITNCTFSLIPINY